MRIATDIGGTFTDLVYVNDAGEIGVAKSDTTPGQFEQGVLDVIRRSGVDPQQIDDFIHGTTVIINALTERKGAKTGLITTKGFRDVLEIARGNRPDLFNVRYHKPAAFVPRHLRLEVGERLDYTGAVVAPLNVEELQAAVQQLKVEGVEAIAISFLHAYTNPVHEQEALRIITGMWPEVQITASHEISQEWREYERTNTAVLNSYVKATAASYIDHMEQRLKAEGVHGRRYVMQSNAGMTSFRQAKQTPIQMVESGPVAGIFGAAILGKWIGEENIIAFDIGGTTAKCSLIDKGEVKVTTDYKIEQNERNAGYPVKVPVVDIVEIGTGGGSIAWIDEGGSLRVGPKSAGALPGPVAYGRGGQAPTTTDANLLTGRLSLDNFASPASMETVRQAIEEQIALPFGLSADEAALGILRIANSNMLNALKLVSVRRGYDPRDFTLIAFGGGGPLHAAALAKELGVRKVVVPFASSVFSAWGMLMTDLRQDHIQTYIRRIESLELAELNGLLAQIQEAGLQAYLKEGLCREDITWVRYADMRYLGQEHTVKVAMPEGELTAAQLAELSSQFHEIHEREYTFRLEGVPVEIVNLHVSTIGSVRKPAPKPQAGHGPDATLAQTGVRPVLFDEAGWLNTSVYNRNTLQPGNEVEGPAIVEEASSSVVVYPGQLLKVDGYGNLIIETEVQSR
ncbi:hydantoinase/oxoprolinase family protein [Paenibacillus sp. GCM10012306]|uniref:hydantoinase/oxoprolinase family protein n=1 Tax=Paenibacillus sp. GCM10012306 TaxID=3317342 RepID=UPI00360E01EC